MGKKRMFCLRMLFTFTIMLLMAAIADASSHNLGTLVGNITDATTGSPIQGANVSLQSTSAKSDYYNNLSGVGGFYTISDIQPANYDINATKAGYKPAIVNNNPINPFQTISINFTLLQTAVTHSVSGYVTNATHTPVENAAVFIAGANRSAKTGAGGFYLIGDVAEGTYDLIAAKSGDGYESAVMLAQSVPGPTVNFTLLKAKDGCNDDCTKADGLCHEECEGKGMCMFNSSETANACNFAAPGLITYGSKSVMCCTGGAYIPRKAEPSINCGGNVISIRIPVLFRGIFATMVLTLFDAIGCNSG